MVMLFIYKSKYLIKDMVHGGPLPHGLLSNAWSFVLRRGGILDSKDFGKQDPLLTAMA